MNHAAKLLPLIVILFCCSDFAESTAAENPNIVFIFADDLGYGDVECFGHPKAKTPHLNQLARDGVLFTQHYANGPECSPTRTAFFTGRYQQRVGGLECAIGTGNVGRYDDAIRLAEQHDLGLPPADAVLPKAIADAGYQCAIFGKWHLGYEAKFNPLNYGWHEFAGYLGGNVHYFNHRETSDLHVLYRGREKVTREGYMTHLITNDAIDFIKRNRQNPFFVMLAHECPHFPYQGPGDSEKKVTAENWMEKDPDAYVVMLEDLDAEIGRVLESIDELGMRKNTLVVFASDNGGVGEIANMGGLRGNKGTTYEGGIRVPLIIRWPGKLNPGTTCGQPCATFDLSRSFLRIAGGSTTQPLDGIDIIEHAEQKKSDVTRDLFWRGRRGDKTWCAIRSGDLKLVRSVNGKDSQQWLFDLHDDIAEKSDLSDQRPKDVARLEKKLRGWEKDVAPRR